jgi:DNA mismatch endonuclease (patch repair protein)
MRNIRSKDSIPEKKLRLELWKRGYRYRKNVKSIIGKPDICFLSRRLAVFCDSDFWHGRFFLEGTHIPKTNHEYWSKKLTGNINRDKLVDSTLKKEGWVVLRFWESEIKRDISKCINDIEKVIRST